MDIFRDQEVTTEPEDMARAAGKRLANKRLVSEYLGRLQQAGLDRRLFDQALADLETDVALAAADVIAIGNGYAVGGIKATSRAAALGRIKKRFNEILRAKSNAEIAAKARPW